MTKVFPTGKPFADMGLKVLAGISNALLSADQMTIARLQAIQGQSIAIWMNDLEIGILLKVTTRTLDLSPLLDSDVHQVRIEIALAKLLEMLIRRQDFSDLGRGDVSFSGDLELGMRLGSIIKEVDLNLEDFLASRIGDTAGYYASRFIGQGAKHCQQLRHDFSIMTADYLVDEIQILASAHQQRDFDRGISTLVHAVHEIEDRLSAIELRLGVAS